jgi:hypothetical protein
MTLKTKQGICMNRISIVGKRANQINISLKEELHNKLEEFASHTDSLEEIHENKEQIEEFRERMKECQIRLYWPPREFLMKRFTSVKEKTIF